MRIVTPSEIEAGGARYIRGSDDLEIVSSTGGRVTLHGQAALKVWSDLLAEACLAVGLRADASIFEIRAWLERPGGTVKQAVSGD